MYSYKAGATSTRLRASAYREDNMMEESDELTNGNGRVWIGRRDRITGVGLND